MERRPTGIAIRSTPRAPQTFWGAIRYLDPACGDHKVIWELNRHQHWLTLGRAYWLTGKARYRGAFIAELEDWLDDEPAAGGASTGRACWSWRFAACRGPGRSSSSRRTPIATTRPGSSTCWSRSIASSTHVAQNLSRYFSPNTHLTGEALALYAASAAFPELREERAPRQELGRRDVAAGDHAPGQRRRWARGALGALSPLLDRLLSARAAGRARRPTIAAADRFEDVVRSHGATISAAIADDRGQLPLLGDDDGGQLFGICGGRPADASATLAARLPR